MIIKHYIIHLLLFYWSRKPSRAHIIYTNIEREMYTNCLWQRWYQVHATGNWSCLLQMCGILHSWLTMTVTNAFSTIQQAAFCLNFSTSWYQPLRGKAWLTSLRFVCPLNPLMLNSYVYIQYTYTNPNRILYGRITFQQINLLYCKNQTNHCCFSDTASICQHFIP